MRPIMSTGLIWERPAGATYQVRMLFVTAQLEPPAGSGKGNSNSSLLNVHNRRRSLVDGQSARHCLRPKGRVWRAPSDDERLSDGSGRGGETAPQRCERPHQPSKRTKLRNKQRADRRLKAERNTEHPGLGATDHTLTSRHKGRRRGRIPNRPASRARRAASRIGHLR